MTGRLGSSIERGSSNLEGAMGVTCGNTIDFFNLEMFSSTHPKKKFLEKTNCQVAAWGFRLSLPAKGTVFDLPDEGILFLSKVYALVGVAVEEVS